MNWRKWILWACAGLAAVAIITALVVRSQRWRPRTISIQGAVIRKDADPRRELPIGNVVVTATDGLMTVRTQSDASGYFNLKFRENVWPGQTVTLSFRSPDYESYDVTVHPGIRSTTQKLYVAALIPIRPDSQPKTAKKASVVSNIRIRYTVNSQGDNNIGSAVLPVPGCEPGQRPLQPPGAMLSRWALEGDHRISDDGRRAGPRVPRCESVVHRGALPIHAHRFQRLQPGRACDYRNRSELVRHGDISSRGGSFSNRHQFQRPRILSR